MNEINSGPAANDVQNPFVTGFVLSKSKCSASPRPSPSWLPPPAPMSPPRLWYVSTEINVCCYLCRLLVTSLGNLKDRHTTVNVALDDTLENECWNGHCFQTKTRLLSNQYTGSTGFESRTEIILILASAVGPPHVWCFQTRGRSGWRWRGRDCSVLERCLCQRCPLDGGQGNYFRSLNICVHDMLKSLWPFQNVAPVITVFDHRGCDRATLVRFIFEICNQSNLIRALIDLWVMVSGVPGRQGQRRGRLHVRQDQG
jgi:hypothetical protein